MPNATADPLAVRFTVSLPSISPVSLAVMSAMLPHTAEISPAIEVDVWLEISQFRSVQLVMFGRPSSVADAHVPANSEDDGEDAGEDDDGELDDEEDDDGDGLDEPLLAEPALVRLPATSPGAVGSSDVDLLVNWQPADRSDQSSVTSKIPFFISVLTHL
jgi:hypothetical protein